MLFVGILAEEQSIQSLKSYADFLFSLLNLTLSFQEKKRDESLSTRIAACYLHYEWPTY